MSQQHAKRIPAALTAGPPEVGDIDTISGQPLSEMEVEFRLKIQQEAEYIAIDAEYADYRFTIHQPLGGDEQGVLDDEGWRLERPSTALQLLAAPRGPRPELPGDAWSS